MKPTIALIGVGRVGTAICKRLHLAGYSIEKVISRDRDRAIAACNFIGCATSAADIKPATAATAQIILLAVPDDQIGPLAQQLQTDVELSTQTTLVHFSGLHSAAIMQHNKAEAMLLSLHPLLPFADNQIAFKKLVQCPCAVESNNPSALATGERLVTAIDAIPFTIASNKKPLYHAAACIASNYLVTLLDSAQQLLNQCGIEDKQTTPLLLPLVKASLDNMQQLGTEQGLTGPIVRGDLGTVANHIEALSKDAPQLLPIYQILGEMTATLSHNAGRLNTATTTKIEQILKTKSQ